MLEVWLKAKDELKLILGSRNYWHAVEIIWLGLVTKPLQFGLNIFGI